MTATSIEWTDHSLNPIRARVGSFDGPRVGHYCEKVSPGCKNCYSSRLQPRFGLPQFQEQRRTMPSLFLDSSKLEEVLRRRKPTKYFWCDMTDMFGDWVPDEWIAACFDMMRQTPHHVHQVLTKRPERMLQVTRRLRFDGDGDGRTWIADSDDAPGYRLMGGNGCTGMPWVWLGTSCEDQPRADERIPVLLKCPAAVRFVSYEPALGPIDARPYLTKFDCLACPKCGFRTNIRVHAICPNDGAELGPDPRIDWVIVGGESGPGARAMHDDWVRSMRDQCVAAGARFFFKQRATGAGKKLSLPMLDGQQWTQFPNSHD